MKFLFKLKKKLIKEINILVEVSDLAWAPQNDLIGSCGSEIIIWSIKEMLPIKKIETIDFVKGIAWQTVSLYMLPINNEESIVN